MIPITELRDALKLAPDQDGTLAAIRLQVIALWEEHSGLLWDKRVDHEQTIRNRCELRTVFLELIPVEQIFLVEVRSESDTDWTELEADDYLLVGARRLRRLGADWPEFVRVTYDGGSENAPADVKQALVLQAQFMSVRTAQGTIAVKSQNFEGGGGVLEEATMHPFFKALVELKARRA